jgi:hypothetical protein
VAGWGQPATAPRPTRNSTWNCDVSNPKPEGASKPRSPWIPPQKDNVSKDERETHVNVGINRTNPKPVATLTLREEDLVEELVSCFRDEKSRVTYRRIVGALGEDLAYRLMRLAWEVRDRMAVSPGAYFVGIAKNVAREHGIDLGFATSRTANSGELRS